MNIIRCDFGTNGYKIKDYEEKELINYFNSLDYEPYFIGTFSDHIVLLDNTYTLVFNMNKENLSNEFKFVTQKQRRFLLFGECSNIYSYDEFINSENLENNLVISFNTYDNTRPGLLFTKNLDYNEIQKTLKLLSEFFSKPMAYMLQKQDIIQLLRGKIKDPVMIMFNNLFITFNASVKNLSFHEDFKHKTEIITL